VIGLLQFAISIRQFAGKMSRCARFAQDSAMFAPTDLEERLI
jgi:hypothetical protein